MTSISVLQGILINYALRCLNLRQEPYNAEKYFLQVDCSLFELTQKADTRFMLQVKGIHPVSFNDSFADLFAQYRRYLQVLPCDAVIPCFLFVPPGGGKWVMHMLQAPARDLAQPESQPWITETLKDGTIRYVNADEDTMLRSIIFPFPSDSSTDALSSAFNQTIQRDGDNKLRLRTARNKRD